MTMLAGQHIFVTGAAQGIGRAVARRLAAGGATLTLLDRSGDGLEDTAKLITDSGGTPPSCALADVTDTSAVIAALAAADDRSPLDGLVNVAGVGLCAQFLDPGFSWPSNKFGSGIVSFDDAGALLPGSQEVIPPTVAPPAAA